MLYEKNLDQIIYAKHNLVDCDEIIIISGYVGPDPIEKINDVKLPTTVIYGMYGNDGIRKQLHNALLKESRELENVKILYSTMPVHSKIYMWRKRGDIVAALIGSANFSTNGLTIPYKEVLADSTVDTFPPLKTYVEKILSQCIPCEKGQVTTKKGQIIETNINEDYDPAICSLPLYSLRDNEVPKKSGINWGLASLTGANVKLNDAYIAITKENIKKYPNLFPEKQKELLHPELIAKKDHRDNDPIDIIWDDGTTMTGLLEGTQEVKNENGELVKYPKQIASSPTKETLGKYLRERLNVPEGYLVTMDDLKKYGRTTIDVSLLAEGIYYFDFSVKEKEEDIDPYDAKNYDNPDDFADEWATEFGNGSYADGYEKALVYWEQKQDV